MAKRWNSKVFFVGAAFSLSLLGGCAANTDAGNSSVLRADLDLSSLTAEERAQAVSECLDLPPQDMAPTGGADVSALALGDGSDDDMDGEVDESDDDMDGEVDESGDDMDDDSDESDDDMDDDSDESGDDFDDDSDEADDDDDGDKIAKICHELLKDHDDDMDDDSDESDDDMDDDSDESDDDMDGSDMTEEDSL